METILLTGFGPFGDHVENLSGQAVERLDGLVLHGFRLKSVVLPVAFEPAVACLEAVLDDDGIPAAVLAVGIHGGENEAFALELIARNERDYEIPDAEGNLVSDERVEADGPAQVVSTLPVGTIKRALEQAGLAAELSDDAGRYLCNAVFYWLARRVSPAGFLHVPPRPEGRSDVIEAVRLAAEVTAQRLAAQRVEATA